MMLEVSETSEDIETFTEIKVQNPSKEYGSYISYEIFMKTNDPSFSHQMSTTRRRYSDFKTLEKLLSKQLPYNKLPLLPPKHPFKKTFDSEFIQERQEALEDFLNKLVSDRMCLSCKALHLFLQSSFRMSEIIDIIEGKAPSHEIQNSVSTFYDSLSSVEERTGSPISNHYISQESNSISSNICAVLKPSSESNTSSPIGNKKVSFCDKVTVAEVHIS